MINKGCEEVVRIGFLGKGAVRWYCPDLKIQSTRRYDCGIPRYLKSYRYCVVDIKHLLLDMLN